MESIAAIYARVSTMQQEQEATIDSQVASIESYARERGYRVLKENYFLDQAVSGASLARPALDRLRDLAGEGQFGTVLCLSPDRLARQYVYQCVLMDELQRTGVKVVFVNQPEIADNPQSHLLLGVQGLFAEYERAMITERLRRGKLYRVRNGQLVHSGAPYGYRYIPVNEVNGGHWEENSREAQVVRQIYLWYTQDPTSTICSIAERLNQLGPQCPPRGKQWGYSVVHAILTQMAYTGQGYYNRTRSCSEVVGQPKKQGRGPKREPGRTLRPKEEWISVQTPALITLEVWQSAQERLVMQQKFSQRNNKHNFYLLRSLLVCDVCGYTLIGRTLNGHQSYYCPHRQGYDLAAIRHSRRISADVIEPLVWQAVSDLLHNPRLLLDAWESQSQPSAANPDETNRLQTRLNTLSRQWQRLIDLYQDEQINRLEFDQRKERLDQERQTIEQRLEQISRLQRQELIKEQMLHDFAAFCQTIEANLAGPTPELQQEVIRMLIEQIVVGENEIVIKHVVPTDDDCRLLPRRM